MIKKELVKVVAQKCGLTQVKAAEILAVITQTITETLKKDEPIVLMGFGTFSTKTRKPRKGISPLTKKPINVPAKQVVRFRASK